MKPVHIIGVPLDLGAGRRGSRHGPVSRSASPDCNARIGDLGRIVTTADDLPAPIPETSDKTDERKKYIHEIARVCETLYAT